MYISHLSIHNYRNFKDFNINLSNFNLIIGENNSGKTNLVESLCLIFGQEITIFKKRILCKDDINYKAVESFRKDILDTSILPRDIKFPEVKIEAEMTGFDETQSTVVGDWFIDRELTKAKLTYLFHVREDWTKKIEWITEQRSKLAGITNPNSLVVDFPIDNYEYVIYGGNDSVNRADYNYLRYLTMEHLDALRDARKELVAGGEYRLLYRLLNSRKITSFSDVKDKLIELQTFVDGHAELELIKAEVKAQLDKISLEDDSNNNSVGFQFASPELNDVFKKVGMIYGEDPITIENNGLGRNNLLYMSLILSHLENNQDINSNVFRLIGIEEPEAHLHPHLQDHLAKNIRNSSRDNLQIILTSHSSNIASKLDLTNTHILFKNGDGEIYEHEVLKGMDMDSESVKYLRKYLDSTNSQMFFAKKLMLIEGPAEQILIPRLFEIHTGKSMEKIGCNLVNVYGLAFRHFLNIIKNGYFIKCAVLTDSDTNEKDGTNRADSLKNDYETTDGPIKICTSQLSTFEKDLINANKSGDGRNILLNTLIQTKPQNGKTYKTSLGSRDIDVETFYDEIENYKSEFALNLLDNLATSSISLPPYIAQGFDFINS